MSETRPVLCGKCHIPSEVRTESDGSEWVSCPICGQQDRMDDAFGEAGEYHVGKLLRTLPLSHSRSMTIKDMPERDYRWIIED
jgi:hypothetical protein